MNGRPDWEAIRKEYEAGGGSLDDLRVKYSIPKTTLHRHLSQSKVERNGTEQKSGTERNEEGSESHSIHVLRTELPSSATAVAGANLGLEGIVQYLKLHKFEMDLADHVKAATALSQYNKIIINAPPDEVEEEEKDFSAFSEDELRQYAEFEERARKKA